MSPTSRAVSLVPIDKDNLAAVFKLDVAEDQREFVARNPWSLAQALVEPAIAWPRAIVRDDEVVGFLMLEIDLNDDRPFWLWRLMVGEGLQGQGIGAAAVALAIEEVKARGGTELFTSWVPGDGTPEPFYLGLGFVPTGEIDDGEVVARLVL